MLGRFVIAVPTVYVKHRRGRTIMYRKGGVRAGGHGRRYPITDTYTGPDGELCSTTLQGCPREVRACC